MTIDEILDRIESDEFMKHMTVGSLKQLAAVVRAADTLAISANLSDHNGRNAGLRGAISNYRKLREGGNSPRESDDQREDGT